MLNTSVPWLLATNLLPHKNPCSPSDENFALLNLSVIRLFSVWLLRLIYSGHIPSTKSIRQIYLRNSENRDSLDGVFFVSLHDFFPLEGSFGFQEFFILMIKMWKKNIRGFSFNFSKIPFWLRFLLFLEIYRKL